MVGCLQQLPWKSIPTTNFYVISQLFAYRVFSMRFIKILYLTNWNNLFGKRKPWFTCVQRITGQLKHKLHQSLKHRNNQITCKLVTGGQLCLHEWLSTPHTVVLLPAWKPLYQCVIWNKIICLQLNLMTFQRDVLDIIKAKIITRMASWNIDKLFRFLISSGAAVSLPACKPLYQCVIIMKQDYLFAT